MKVLSVKLKRGESEQVRAERAMPSKKKLIRATIFLPAAMAQNLAALSLQTGESQASIIRQALAAYMKKAGYDPYKHPRIRVTH